MFTIPKDIKSNLWEVNPHLIYLKPFSQLYLQDKDSKHLWCIIWLSHPDEEDNKYYRLPDDERLQVCMDFNPKFNVEDPLIQECIDRVPDLCLDSVQQVYKESKDQLLKINRFLNKQEINLENVEQLVKVKAGMPKIFKEFGDIEKQFQKSKSDQRVHGGRAKTIREKKYLQPEE